MEHGSMELMAQQQGILEAIGTYGKQLLGFIRSRVGNDADAEDILQDVWYQLSNQPELEAIGSISGWLYRVAKNKIIDRSRKSRPASLEVFAYDDEDEGRLRLPSFMDSDSSDPATEQLKQLFWETLTDALEELPEKQRTVFVLNEMEEVTLREIAEKEGENLKTIISRKRYAVQYLRRRLEAVYNEFLNY
jgi:RNA polymerase sigma factor (sigma-70 family)